MYNGLMLVVGERMPGPWLFFFKLVLNTFYLLDSTRTIWLGIQHLWRQQKGNNIIS